MANQNEKRVKVQPYPFPISIHKDGKILSAQVLKLAQKGAILGVRDLVFMVGSELTVQFELPVHKVELSLAAKVIKTYDRASLKENKVERLIEIHFPTIQTDQVKAIYKFLVAIRQVGP